MMPVSPPAPGGAADLAALRTARAAALSELKSTALEACERVFQGLKAGAGSDALRDELAGLHDRVGELDRRLCSLDHELAEHHATRQQLARLLTEATGASGHIGLGRLADAMAALQAGDLAPAGLILAEIAALNTAPADQAARIAFGQGLIAEEAMRWTEAARHYATAARLDPDLAALRKARQLACRTGDLTTAFRLGKGLLVLAETTGTPEDRALAMSEHAETLEAQERWTEAEGFLRKAVQSGRTAGASGPRHAAALARLGRVLEAQDRLDDAEALLRKALEVSRQSLGEAHPDYAARLAQLAGLLAGMERDAEAEPLLQKALDLARRVPGGAHPVVVDCLAGLAGLAEAQQRFTVAEDYHRMALKVGRDAVGPTHPDHASRLCALAEVVRAQRRLPEAEALFRQALEIDRATIGEGHRDYGVGLNNLAGVVEAQGRPAEAEALYAAALDIFRRTLGDLHPATLKVAKNFRALIAAHLPHSPHRAGVEMLWQAGQEDPRVL